MFILRSDGGFLQASGIRKQLAGKAASLDMQARTFFRDWRKDEGPALLVGALPFNNDRDHLVYQPDDVWRSPSLDPARLSVGASKAAAPVRYDNFRSIPSARGYADKVVQALEAMRDGDLQKVVLARRLSARLRGHIDPLPLLDRLAVDPSASLFLLDLACGSGLPPHYLVGATPELLIRRQGRNILSNPLAGSARRLPGAQQDRDAGQALLQSEKDRREHRLVVDYIGDCLSPYCAQLVVGSPSLHSTATMWHLGTRIEGRLREEDAPGAAGLAALLHPTPAVGGVPQAPALEAIARLEGQDRGFYAGALGWCDRDGDGAWYVTLRCAEMEADQITLHAGAGIVPGSDPQAEVNETAAKFRAMLRALDLDEAAFEETVLS